MKTTTFSLLMAALLLSACARDAEVLSKDDKAFLSNRQNKGGDNQNAPGKARLPQKMEVALGILAEARILQAQQILALAQDLSATPKEQKDCVQIRPLSGFSDKTFRLDYTSCSPSTQAFEATLTGYADLTLQTNEKGELTGLKYETRGANTRQFSSMLVFARSKAKDSKDTLLIEESVSLSMTRQAGSDLFSIVNSSAEMILHNGYKDTATTTEVSNFFDGTLSASQINSWHADMQGQGQNEGATGNPVIFSFSSNTPAGKADGADFKFQMGKTKRSGTLAFNEKDVTVKSQDGDSKISRQKSQKIESLPALELWF